MKIWSIAIALILLISCDKGEKSLILVSKDNHSNIEKWLHKVDSSLEVKVFYDIPRDSMGFYLQEADGIVLGGGEDVHPAMYGHEEYLNACEDMDLYRDSIEQVLIRFAFDHQLPLLGICRGEQILNAASGGTLIPDIPSFLNTSVTHRGSTDHDHAVILSESSWLKNLLNQDTLWVNSRHHQCVDTVAPGFIVAALAPDGVVEAIRYADTLQQPFIAGVQWHPEGLLDEPSMKIAGYFLEKIKH